MKATELINPYRTTVTNLWHLTTPFHMDKCNDNVKFGTWTIRPTVNCHTSTTANYTCMPIASTDITNNIYTSLEVPTYDRQCFYKHYSKVDSYTLGSLKWLDYLSQMVQCYLLENLRQPNYYFITYLIWFYKHYSKVMVCPWGSLRWLS